MDIQVGDRVTFRVEGTSFVETIDNLSSVASLKGNKKYEILKIERPTYTVVEEKKELLTEEAKDNLLEIKEDFDWDLQHKSSRTNEEIDLANKYSKAIETVLQALEGKDKIMKKDTMTADEAIDIIDEMYQDRMKQIEKNNTIYADKIENVQFTNLEFAGVRLLREVQSLRRKLKNSIPTKKIEDKIKELEPELELQHLKREARLQIRLLQELLEA